MASPACQQPLTLPRRCSVSHVSKAMPHGKLGLYCTCSSRLVGQLLPFTLHCISPYFPLSSSSFLFAIPPVEHTHSTSRIIFLTDLCSTVDSVNDEHKLLSTIKKNAERGIYTTVVGIGMVCICFFKPCVHLHTSIVKKLAIVNL